MKKIKGFIYSFFILYTGLNYSQNFNQSTLNYHGVGSISLATSLMYSPDDRLYVAEYTGLKVLTVDHTENNNYVMTSMEILAEPIADQINNIGDVLDVSLAVIANDGGNPSFTATGLPPGLSIDMVTGIISGTISLSAETNNPYTVMITIDDSRSFTYNAVMLNFSWTVNNLNHAIWNDKVTDQSYSGRHECSFVQAGDKFYLMGGRENARTLDVYDYGSDSWVSLVDSAPVEFNHYQATEYQGLIWVIGAFKTNDFPNEVPADFIWAFDPVAQEWIQGPEIPNGRKRGSTGLVVYNEKFYILAGNTMGHNGGYVAWFDEYDPVTGIWTTLDDAPRARDHFHAMVIGDKLYAAGGRLSGGTGGTFKPVIPEVDVFDFTSGTWSTLPASQNLPTPRGAPAVANFNGKLMVIGGEVENELVYGVNTDDALKITEEYDPATETWTRLADMNFKRHGTQAIVSGSGVFILAGSPNKGGGNQKTMEYYGVDNPVGNVSIASVISAPIEVTVNGTSGSSFSLDVTGGNIGIPIRSMNISGTDAIDFQISSGLITNGLIKANASHNLSILYTGSIDNANADLIINYGASDMLTISLRSENGALGVDELSSKRLDILFFPNPTSSETQIRISDASLELSEIQIYDISGRLVKKYNAPKLRLEAGLYKFNTLGLKDGIYFVNLKTNETTLFGHKLIIKK